MHKGKDINKAGKLVEYRKSKIKELYINDGEVKIIIHKDSVKKLQDEVHIFMIDQKQVNYCYTGKKVEFDDEVHIILNLEEWALKIDSISGIYNIYIQSEDELIALEYSGTEEDFNEVNKKIHRVVVIDKEGIKFSIKIYYAKNGLLTMKISKLIEVKKIDTVEIESGYIRITGIMCIRRVYNVEEDKMYGRITVELENGEERVFSYMADVVFKEGTDVQYDYVMTIAGGDIKNQGFNSKEIAIALSKNVAKCSIDAVDGRVEYIMNVKPENLMITLKDRIKKGKIIKDMINKLKRLQE